MIINKVRSRRSGGAFTLILTFPPQGGRNRLLPSPSMGEDQGEGETIVKHCDAICLLTT